MTTIIGTHSGSFHADDVFAIATLTMLHPDYEIRRSRDPEVWKTCDYLVDVGGFYDHSQRIYDHHFRNAPAYHDGLKMSSVGLIWKHYGEQVCGSKEVAERVCYSLIRGLDANDNGVSLSQPIEGAPEACEVSLSGMIAMMNPIDRSRVDEVFCQEVERARLIIQSSIDHAKQWFDSHHEVQVALKEALRERRRYIVVSEDCKWVGHLLSMHENHRILYVVYPHGPKWYLRGVPQEKGSFANRKDFPDAWGGLRDEEFSEVTGIPDGIFCHHGLFICAAQSYESAIKLVNLAIKA